MDMNLSRLQDIVTDREACHAAIHGVAELDTQLSDWTTIPPVLPNQNTIWILIFSILFL